MVGWKGGGVYTVHALQWWQATQQGRRCVHIVWDCCQETLPNVRHSPLATCHLPLATAAPSKAEADIFFMTLQGGNIKPETVREQLRSCPVSPLVPWSRRKLKCKWNCFNVSLCLRVRPSSHLAVLGLKSVRVKWVRMLSHLPPPALRSLPQRQC